MMQIIEEEKHEVDQMNHLPVSQGSEPFSSDSSFNKPHTSKNNGLSLKKFSELFSPWDSLKT